MSALYRAPATSPFSCWLFLGSQVSSLTYTTRKRYKLLLLVVWTLVELPVADDHSERPATSLMVLSLIGSPVAEDHPERVATMTG